MFISIPEEKFRIDISSTEIRKSHGLWCIKYGHILQQIWDDSPQP
jgi:hypothetical protein